MTPDVNVRSLQFVRVFPWVRIGRAIGCALAPSQLVLGVMATLLWWLLREVFVQVAPSRGAIVIDTNTLGDWAWIPHHLYAVLTPVSAVVAPWGVILREPNLRNFWPLLESSAAFVLWTIFGVALVRCAAVQFCRDQGPSFRLAAQWSLNRCVASLTSILTPLGGLLVMAAAMACLALPGVVPALGQVWLTVAAPFEVLLGLAAAFVALLLPVLWPLMVAGVAVDAADSFSAFSRSFSYLTTYLWSAALLVLWNILAAAVALIVVHWISEAAELAVAWVTSQVLGAETHRALLRSVVWCLGLARHAFAASLFWTHVAIVYVFLRESVDGTPVDTLAGFEDDTRFHEPYPVVGMPAVQPPAAT